MMHKPYISFFVFVLLMVLRDIISYYSGLLFLWVIHCRKKTLREIEKKYSRRFILFTGFSMDVIIFILLLISFS